MQDSTLALALRADGRVFGWGADSYGECTAANSLTNVATIAAGGHGGLAITKGGGLVSWPWDDSFAAGVSNALAISVGAGRTADSRLVLKKDGTLLSWGSQFGSLPSGSNYIAITLGYGHGLALANDGTVCGWGQNSAGQATGTPNKTYDYRSSGLVKINNEVLHDVIEIAAGKYFSMALRRDGTIVGWGDSWYQKNIPLDLSGVTAVSAGQYFCLAITTNSGVVAKFNHSR